MEPVGNLEHVLVVDPDPQTGALVQEAWPGVTTHRVDSVYEALYYLECEPIDLVVAERLLPGADGETLVSRLRRLDRPPPVILASHLRGPLVRPDDRVIAVLSKPLDVLALRAALETASGPPTTAHRRAS